MAALDPSLVQALAATAWDTADGAEQADLTTEATNDTTGAGINVATASKIGKGGSPHGDIMRVAFDQDFPPSVNDTVTVELEGLHNVSDMAMLAYDAATTVVTTAKIVQTSVSGTTVWTFTQAFIDELVELGSGGWAVRIVEDLSTGGDWQLSEVDANITPAGVVFNAVALVRLAMRETSAAAKTASADGRARLALATAIASGVPPTGVFPYHVLKEKRRDMRAMLNL